MEEVIGLRGNKKASLMSFGITYDEIPLVNNLDIDFEKLEQRINKKLLKGSQKFHHLFQYTSNNRAN